MTIRTATDADRAAIAAIQAASWRTAYAAVLPQAWLEGRLEPEVLAHWLAEPIPPQDVVLLAEAPEPCGFIAVRDGPVPYIANLPVRPEWRTRGIGRLLMQAAARALMETGRDTAYLWGVESNAGAIRFYRRLGGQFGQEADREMFGNPVRAIRVDGPDLRVMLAAP